jgi:hypothetical protein
MKRRVRIETTNMETGEFTEEERIGGIHGKFVDDNSSAAYREFQGGKFDIHHLGRYGKYYFDRIDLILEDNLPYNELRLLLAVQSFATKMHTGEILHEDLSPVTTEELCKKAHVDISRGRAALAGLKRRRLIDSERKGRATKYYINPFVFVCGMTIEWGLLNRFKDSKWANLRKAGANE